MTDSCPIIIAGPTASGKSQVAEYLCDALNGVIINADSLQIYKGLPRLTAQPSIQKGRHVLYSDLEPWDKCDVVRWAERAKHEIITAQQHHKRPIIVGGTGLYLKVLMDGIAPVPDIPKDILNKAEQLIHRYGLNYLYIDLKEKSSPLPEYIKPTDSQRLIRAWTVFEFTGKPLSEWYSLQQASPFKFFKILCMHERTVLNERINQRFEFMWKNGILEEIQVFNSNYHNINDNYAAKAIGFEEVNAYLSGQLTETEAILKAQTKTRQYAKRQVTWFKHQFHYDFLLNGTNFKLSDLMAMDQIQHEM